MSKRGQDPSLHRLRFGYQIDGRKSVVVRDRFRAMFGDGDANLCGLVHDGFPCDLPNRHDGECATHPTSPSAQCRGEGRGGAVSEGEG